MSVNLVLVLVSVAVVAMVVGPVMMMQPSAAQRRQEALRLHAIQRGLRVKIVSLPQQRTDREEPTAIPMFCLPHSQGQQCVSEWLLLRGAYAHEAHFWEEWLWFKEPKITPKECGWLREKLPFLPKSVAAVGCDLGGVSVYWSEAGGESVLDGLADMLRDFQAIK